MLAAATDSGLYSFARKGAKAEGVEKKEQHFQASESP